MTPIPNFENEYAIDKAGTIYSLPRKVVGIDGTIYPIKGKKLTILLNKQTGYKQVDLWKNNTGKRMYIHRLLAIIFIPNPEHKPEINHKNSNRSDNSLNNLEWVTSSENSYHAYAHGFASQKLKRKLIEDDYINIFNRFISGESFANILIDYDISAGRLSINLRALIIKWNKEKEFYSEKLRQQQVRAKINGSN